MFNTMEHVTLMGEPFKRVQTHSSLSSYISAQTLGELRDILDKTFDMMLRFKDEGMVYTHSLDWFGQVRDIAVTKDDSLYRITGEYTDNNGYEISLDVRYLIWESSPNEQG